jgi:hypothetical protein
VIDPAKWVARLRASNVGSAKNDYEPRTIVMVVRDDTKHGRQLYIK